MEVPEGYTRRDEIPPIEGGQATIVAAVRDDGKKVAFKFFFPHLLKRPAFVERIRREGSRVWSLQNINEFKTRIVPLVEPPEYGKGRFLVYEWMDGGSLADRRKGQNTPLLPPKEAAILVSELAATVHLFSETETPSPVHRDIHPKNILFADETWNLPRLSDFGLVTGDDISITQFGEKLGVTGFRPPDDPASATVKYDVYSLGAILYFVLTGKWPPETPIELRVRLRTDDGFKKGEVQAPFTHLRGALSVSTDANPDRRPLPKDFSNGLRYAVPGGVDPFVPQIDETSSNFDQIDSVQKAIELTEYDSSTIGATVQRVIDFRRKELTDHIEYIDALEEIGSSRPLADQVRDDDYRNLLFLAIEAGDVGVVQHLVSVLKFSVHSRDRFGWTPLHLAASLGRLEIMRYLLDAKADPMARTEQEATVAYEAAFCDRDQFPEVFNILRKYTTPEQQRTLLTEPSLDNFTPLLVACWRGNHKSVKYLMSLDHTLAKEQQAENGEDALDLAVKSQSKKAVLCLVETMIREKWERLCTNRNQPEEDEEETAFTAARDGKTEYFLPQSAGERSQFEISGLKVNAHGTRYSRTLLHEAAENGHYKIVEILCSHPEIRVLAHNNHGRLASDLVPKKRRDIAFLLLDKESKERQASRRKTLENGGEPSVKS